MKKCATCKEEKSLECFSKSKPAIDGLSPSCKECAKKNAKEWRAKNKWNGISVESKLCVGCKTTKQAKEFYNDKSRVDGLSSQCTECVKTYRVKNRAKLLADSKAYNKKVAESAKKEIEGRVCSQCKVFKNKDEFWKSKHTTDGLYTCCIECKKKLDSTESRINNKRELARKFALKRRNDVVYRLRSNAHSAILSSIKRYYPHLKRDKLAKDIFEKLPYSPEDLKRHLESLWEPWMSWENHGYFDRNRKTWQIDHIMPQSKLPFASLDDDNFQKLWALSNIRPLDALQNIKKRNKIIDI